MYNFFKIFLLICGILFDIIIIRLLIKKKINEKDSIIWFIFIILIFILSAFPQLLEGIAMAVGIDYPPALLFLFSILVMLYLLLNNYIEINVLREQVRELAQQISLINYNLKEGEDKYNRDHKVIDNGER